MIDNLSNIILKALERENDVDIFYEKKMCYNNQRLKNAIALVQRKFEEKDIKEFDTMLIMADKSCITVATYIACFLSGIVAVPIDRRMPGERLEYIISQCNPKMVGIEANIYAKHAHLFEKHCIEYIDYDEMIEQLEKVKGEIEINVEEVSQEAVAYIIFTSGSTGLPKGVSISRNAFYRFVKASLSLELYSEKTFLFSFAPLYVDASLFEIFIPWLSGGRVYLYNKFLFINDVIKKINKFEITDISCNPVIISLLAEEKKLLEKYNIKKLNSIFYGGESADVNAIQLLWEILPNLHIYNGYGPTETVVICSCHEVKKEDVERREIPIGLPLSGLEFFVKENGKKNEGELLVSGEQMLNFYCNEKDIDIFEIIDGKKYYPTGDLVVYKQKNYYLLGRKSKLIKLRGYRIFPSEIENVIKLVEGVSEAVVFKKLKEEKLVAIIETTGEEKSFLTEKILGEIKSKLPLYMFPKEVHIVEHIQRMESGKIDYSFLINKYAKF